MTLRPKMVRLVSHCCSSVVVVSTMTSFCSFKHQSSHLLPSRTSFPYLSRLVFIWINLSPFISSSRWFQNKVEGFGAPQLGLLSDLDVRYSFCPAPHSHKPAPCERCMLSLWVLTRMCTFLVAHFYTSKCGQRPAEVWPVLPAETGAELQLNWTVFMNWPSLFTWGGSTWTQPWEINFYSSLLCI